MITKALIIDEPWISKILNGEKCWEMRSTNSSFRGEFGLIRKGSGQVVGIANLTGVSGPYDDAELEANIDKHHVGAEIYRSPEYKWRNAWHLSAARALQEPVPYIHKNGAVTWVELDDEAVARLAGLGATDTNYGRVKSPAQRADSMRRGDISAPKPRQAEAFKTSKVVAVQVVKKIGVPKNDEIQSGWVPKAKDGTCFTPDLCNNKGLYTVGEKGDEQKYRNYEEALAYLRAMPKAKWRRPNDNGNWGIVSAVQWVSI